MLAINGEVLDAELDTQHAIQLLQAPSLRVTLVICRYVPAACLPSALRVAFGDITVVSRLRVTLRIVHIASSIWARALLAPCLQLHSHSQSHSHAEVSLRAAARRAAQSALVSPQARAPARAARSRPSARSSTSRPPRRPLPPGPPLPPHSPPPPSQWCAVHTESPTHSPFRFLTLPL